MDESGNRRQDINILCMGFLCSDFISHIHLGGVKGSEKMLENIIYYLLGFCMGYMAAIGDSLFVTICISLIILGLIMTRSYNGI